jgi:hypothetical protein
MSEIVFCEWRLGESDCPRRFRSRGAGGLTRRRSLGGKEWCGGEWGPSRGARGPSVQREKRTGAYREFDWVRSRITRLVCRRCENLCLITRCVLAIRCHVRIAAFLGGTWRAESFQTHSGRHMVRQIATSAFGGDLARQVDPDAFWATLGTSNRLQAHSGRHLARQVATRAFWAIWYAKSLQGHLARYMAR